ncbi:hypothetical protein NQ317_007653 [Molorchus minor]|uniref:Uncharacterized protein n=1 Tax=Molorchus minor TaxID=1323400 RepID=A0ABQ9JRC5_9CUCU|nr:hypothetical protein NQ317_007653 [Molorchus minor]
MLFVFSMYILLTLGTKFVKLPFYEYCILMQTFLELFNRVGRVYNVGRGQKLIETKVLFSAFVKNMNNSYLKLTITPVDQIRPNDHLLREAEHSQLTSLVSLVKYIARISYQLVSLEYFQSNKTDMRSVHQEPPVGNSLFPTDVLRVSPQRSHLTRSVTRVPHFRVNHFDLDAWLGVRVEWSLVPVGLSLFLPHYRVELLITLITENKNNLINQTVFALQSTRINEESPLKIDTIKLIVTNCKSRIAVDGLVIHKIAVIPVVRKTVTVKVIVAVIALLITVCVVLIRVWNSSAVVVFVRHPISKMTRSESNESENTDWATVLEF